VAAFLCRALIPNGYMPVMNAAQGAPILGLCSGTEAGFAADPRAGHASGHPDAGHPDAGHPANGHPDDGHPDHRICPFSLAAAHVALPVQASLAVVALLARSLVLHARPARPTIAAPVSGPPLGSRAPPLNLA
jgi:hypothetical protein